jgi:hypothetical protein
VSDLRPLLAPGVALVVVWATALSFGPFADTQVNDFNVYLGYVEAARDGLYPYRDYELEYPPLALGPILLPGLLTTDRGPYEDAFGVLMLLVALVVLWLTARLAGPRARTAAWLVALAPLLTGSIIRARFDLVPVALTLAALLALLRDRVTLCFGLLGAGAMTKLFPALLVPVVAAWLWSAGRQRELARGLVAFLAVVVVVSAPFLGEGYLDAFSFQLERPVQIESTPASVLFALGDSEVTGTTANPDRFKSNGLDGGAANLVAAVFAVALAAVLALVVAGVARRPGDRHALLLGVLAALLAFAGLGKVLSPQFLVWLVPFAALAWVSGERALALLCATAIGVTHAEFPNRYTLLVGEDEATIVVVAIRNGLLLAALSLALARLLATARWRPRASAATP